AFEAYDYSRALEVTESFFWSFCDDYVEVVKERAYGQQGPQAAASAHATLGVAISVMLRLFAPVLPFVTEEAWSWTHDSSVHRSHWPQLAELSPGATGNAELVDAVAAVLVQIRRAKTEVNVSMRAEVDSATVRAPADQLALLRTIEADLKAVGSIAAISFEEAEQISADLVLAASS
ncbi:MAG TPA: valine--tRNA ligase, partial [Actinobacteria bacterium]|nr:valine--tRNA ligase [Actinomycetota bacterium]